MTTIPFRDVESFVLHKWVSRFEPLIHIVDAYCLCNDTRRARLQAMETVERPCCSLGEIESSKVAASVQDRCWGQCVVLSIGAFSIMLDCRMAWIWRRPTQLVKKSRIWESLDATLRLARSITSLPFSRRTREGCNIRFHKKKLQKVGQCVGQSQRKVWGRCGLLSWCPKPENWKQVVIRDQLSKISRDFPGIFLRNPQKDPGNGHGFLEFSDFYLFFFCSVASSCSMSSSLLELLLSLCLFFKNFFILSFSPLFKLILLLLTLSLSPLSNL